MANSDVVIILCALSFTFEYFLLTLTRRPKDHLTFNLKSDIEMLD